MILKIIKKNQNQSGFTQHYERPERKSGEKWSNVPKVSFLESRASAYGTGFTLIETLVSVTILGVILMVVTNLFASTLGAGKQALDYQKLADELRNTIFSIEKDINNGNGIANAPSNPSSILEVYDASGDLITYSLDNATKKIQKINGANTIILTSDNIEVNVMNFHVINTLLDSDPSNDSQPRVTITIEAKPKNGRKTIKAQTTISEKNY